MNSYPSAAQTTAKLFLGGVFVLLPLLTHATTVQNSVHISADGSKNSASVYTKINGEVVNDWSKTSSSSISYSSNIQYPSQSVTSVSTETPVSTAVERAKLEQLLAQLQVLISLYVTLTSH